MALLAARLAVDGQSFEATVGFDPESGQPRELFLNGGKEGSQFDAMLRSSGAARMPMLRALFAPARGAPTHYTGPKR